MGNIKAVIWDLDGTLLNTLDDLTNSVNFALKQYHLPEHSRDEVRMMVGNGTHVLFERAVPDGEKNPAFQEVVEAFLAHYKEHDKDCTAPYPGILETLDQLSALGIQNAVVSNKIDFAVRSLCKEYFGDRMQSTVGDNPSRRKKPAPDSVLEAMRQMNVSRSETVYVGDSNVDIETARNAGVPGIGVLWGFRDRANLEAAGAEYIAENPQKLLQLICSF